MTSIFESVRFSRFLVEALFCCSRGRVGRKALRSGAVVRLRHNINPTLLIGAVALRLTPGQRILAATESGLRSEA